MSTPFNEHWLEMGACVPVDVETTSAILEELQRERRSKALMTKEDAIKLIKLLSALESWSFSAKIDLPDYLHEDLSIALEKLEKIVLEKQ